MIAIAGNPVLSAPNGPRLAAALERLETLQQLARLLEGGLRRRVEPAQRRRIGAAPAGEFQRQRRIAHHRQIGRDHLARQLARAMCLQRTG